MIVCCKELIQLRQEQPQVPNEPTLPEPTFLARGTSKSQKRRNNHRALNSRNDMELAPHQTSTKLFRSWMKKSDLISSQSITF